MYNVPCICMTRGCTVVVVIYSANEMRHETIFLCSVLFFSYMAFKWFMFVLQVLGCP